MSHGTFQVSARSHNLLVRVLVDAKSLCARVLLTVPVSDDLPMVLEGRTNVGVVNLLVLGHVLEELLILHLGAIRTHVTLVGIVVAESAHHMVGLRGHRLRSESGRAGSILKLGSFVGHILASQIAPVAHSGGVVVDLLDGRPVLGCYWGSRELLRLAGLVQSSCLLDNRHVKVGVTEIR